MAALRGLELAAERLVDEAGEAGVGHDGLQGLGDALEHLGLEAFHDDFPKRGGRGCR